jgi:hypothetical protein
MVLMIKSKVDFYLERISNATYINKPMLLPMLKIEIKGVVNTVSFCKILKFFHI